MQNTTVRRERGIPGSNAAEQVAAMGGPVARRASRRSSSSPDIIDLDRQSASPITVEVDDDEEERPTISQRAQRHVDAVRFDDDEELLEAPPDADIAAPEGWTSPRARRSTASRSLQHGRENRALSTIPRRRSIECEQTDPLPQTRQGSHWLLPLGGGMLLIIVLYTAVFWVYLLGLGIANRLSYGPTPTAETRAVLGLSDSQTDPSVILASNINGRVVVTILPGGEPAKAFIYQLPMLSPTLWGNLNDVVATVEVQQQSATPNIVIHLVGDPDYWHFFARPALSIVLVNTGKGFQVLTGAQQGQGSIA